MADLAPAALDEAEERFKRAFPPVTEDTLIGYLGGSSRGAWRAASACRAPTWRSSRPARRACRPSCAASDALREHALASLGVALPAPGTTGVRLVGRRLSPVGARQRHAARDLLELTAVAHAQPAPERVDHALAPEARHDADGRLERGADQVGQVLA